MNADFIAVAVVSLIAAISPGPDFCVVFRNSVVHSRTAGLMTAFGVATALIVHLTYTMVGIAVLIQESPLLYSIIKYGGVAYLFYIGISGVRSAMKSDQTIQIDQEKGEKNMSAKSAFMQGLLTNLLNPKCALFFMSLFSQFVNASTPGIVKFSFAFINWAVSLGWFLVLAYLTSSRHFLTKITSFRRYIDGVMGVILMLLGARLLFI